MSCSSNYALSSPVNVGRSRLRAELGAWLAASLARRFLKRDTSLVDVSEVEARARASDVSSASRRASFLSVAFVRFS